MSVSLPLHLRRQQPGWQENLASNKHRLVTMFDLHRTLVQLLPGLPPAPDRNTTRTPLNLLAGQVPQERSCSDAGVPEHYCVCTPESYLPLRSGLVTAAARSLLARINSLVAPHSNLCQKQRLHAVREARRLDTASRAVSWCGVQAQAAVFFIVPAWI